MRVFFCVTYRGSDMKKCIYVFCLFSVLCGVNAASNDDWGYSNNIAPQYWANINPLYLGCEKGNQQSPINIVTKNIRNGADSFTLQYNVAKGINLTLQHYTFVITYPKGNFLEISGVRYQLMEIHLKTPGENAIDSMRGIIEAQFFHEDSRGNKLVLAVFMVEGRSNPVIETLIKNLPTMPDKSNFIANIDINQLLPKNLSSYQFNGSLTMPPCSQGVKWIILKQPISVTQSQADALRIITDSNARALQDSFGRLIVGN